MLTRERLSTGNILLSTDENQRSSISPQSGCRARALLVGLYRLLTVVFLLVSLVYLRIFQNDLSLVTFSAQSLVLLSVSLTTLHCVSLSQACLSRFQTIAEQSLVATSHRTDVAELEHEVPARFALDDADDDGSMLDAVPNTSNLSDVREEHSSDEETPTRVPTFRGNVDPTGLPQLRHRSWLQNLLFKLPDFVENLFLMAFANTIFLDAVWWVLLRPRAEKGVLHKIPTYLLHGPPNFVLCFIELLMSGMRARRAAVIFGVVYVVAYFLFSVVHHRISGQWLYFFFDLQVTRNWFIILGLLSWYCACHALIFLFATVRDRLWRRHRLAAKERQARALFRR
ncbi:hypothetical protein CCYA_CCYA10G2942 [Cyanidiococcus yangmingshanensis]|nr:hypothetical protein CCYA_CCYA10G2942 [Cyanidiococcus yangmingshanensis]